MSNPLRRILACTLCLALLACTAIAASADTTTPATYRALDYSATVTVGTELQDTLNSATAPAVHTAYWWGYAKGYSVTLNAGKNYLITYTCTYNGGGAFDNEPNIIVLTGGELKGYYDSTNNIDQFNGDALTGNVGTTTSGNIGTQTFYKPTADGTYRLLTLNAYDGTNDHPIDVKIMVKALTDEELAGVRDPGEVSYTEMTYSEALQVGTEKTGTLTYGVNPHVDFDDDLSGIATAYTVALEAGKYYKFSANLTRGDAKETYDNNNKSLALFTDGAFTGKYIYDFVNINGEDHPGNDLLSSGYNSGETAATAYFCPDHAGTYRLLLIGSFDTSSDGANGVTTGTVVSVTEITQQEFETLRQDGETSYRDMDYSNMVTVGTDKAGIISYNENAFKVDIQSDSGRAAGYSVALEAGKTYSFAANLLTGGKTYKNNNKTLVLLTDKEFTGKYYFDFMHHSGYDILGDDLLKNNSSSGTSATVFFFTPQTSGTYRLLLLANFDTSLNGTNAPFTDTVVSVAEVPSTASVTISTPDELISAAQKINNGDYSFTVLGGKKTFVTLSLANDLDMTGKVYPTITNFDNCTFNGNQHKISNLTAPLINNANNASISDLLLDNMALNITADNKASFPGSIGGLVCYSNSQLTVSNCAVAGSFTMASTFSAVGGMFGKLENNCLVTNSMANVMITVNTPDSSCDYIGGMVGYLEDYNIFWNCASFGDISVSNSDGYSAGGFAAYADEYNQFISCAAKGKTLSAASMHNVGGFLGTSDCCGSNQLMSCYAQNNVQGDYSVGGFIGNAYDDDRFVACYASGTATGNRLVGAFCGNNDSSTFDAVGCYAQGDADTVMVNSSSSLPIKKIALFSAVTDEVKPDITPVDFTSSAAAADAAKGLNITRNTVVRYGKWALSCFFVPNGTTLPEGGFVSTYGDLNEDNKVNTTDALIALRYAVGKLEPNDMAFLEADVNIDNTLNTTDALLILRRSVNKIDSFTAETFFTEALAPSNFEE